MIDIVQPSVLRSPLLPTSWQIIRVGVGVFVIGGSPEIALGTHHSQGSAPAWPNPSQQRYDNLTLHRLTVILRGLAQIKALI